MSRAFFISGPALWTAPLMPIRNAETILTFRKLLKYHLFDLAVHLSASASRIPVEEPALASNMTCNHAKNLCASELGPLKI